MPIKNKELLTHQPKSARGQDSMEQVVGTATRMLRERWIADISISELARESGVVRASLLFAFPNGWPDVANTVAIRTLFEPFDKELDALLERPPRVLKPGHVTRVLSTLLDLAQQTGRLLPNLRAQMFVWGEDNQAIFRHGLQDWNAGLASVLAGKEETKGTAHIAAAENLINFTLDLAAGAGYVTSTEKWRRAILKDTVELIFRGIGKNL